MLAKEISMRSILRVVALLSIIGLACSGVSCNSSSSAPGGQFKLQGAGASFPAPLYGKWFKAYNAAHPNVQIDYQSNGSGAGIKALIDKTVDFGASDMAMKPEEIKQVDVGVQLLPMTAGCIVLAYNLEGVDDLKLSRDAYVGIFLGKITKWNDPAIAKTNEGVKLPDAPVNVVVRADSSGTTYVFTKHLSAISEEFAKSPGTNKMPNWPVGTKSLNNEGIAGSLATTPGAIGYMEYGYAKMNKKIKVAKLQNKAGKFIEANLASAQAALASVKMPEDMITWVSDPEGDGSYPIVTYTWIMCYKKYAEAKKANALKDVLNYCLTEGQKQSEALGYVPLPEKVVSRAQAALANISSDEGAASKTP
jgi:phosphate transport system substrate-binding protein